MSSETVLEASASPSVVGSSSSPTLLKRNSPSPPCTTTSLASHLLAAVSQVQSLSSHLPPSLPLPSSSPPGGALAGGYCRSGLLGGMPNLQFGSEPPMSSLLAGLKEFPRQYHSPPPLPSTESHECKIVEYRGAKVAAFIINGETMLCLPQAFELFLKHLVGGLHTVYTKLKRLSIEPIVCNVDQVRILRGLGAIQPGVNRCKLLSMQHFDILYRDCTTARPGRPPKRASDFMAMTPTHDAFYDLKKRHLDSVGAGQPGLLHGLNGCSPPGMPNGGTGSINGVNGMFANGHLDHRLDKSPLLGNGYHAPPHFNPLQYMAQHMAGLGYPPLLPGGLPGGLSGGLPGGPGVPHPISPTDGSPLKHPPIKTETLARIHEERLERERQLSNDQRRGSLPPTFTPTSLGSSTLLQHHLHQQQHLFQQHQLQQQQQQQNKLHSVSAPYTPTSLIPPSTSSPTPPTSSANSTVLDDAHDPHGSASSQAQQHSNNKDSDMNNRSASSRNGSPILNLSKVDEVTGQDENRAQDRLDTISHDSERAMHDDDDRQQQSSSRDEERLSEMDDDDIDKDESMDTLDMWGRSSSTPGQTQLGPSPISSMIPPVGLLGSAPLSSTEVLLRNILGLLRVAEENARHHERRTQHEKAELKMEVLREREMRESLEKQLQEEHKNRILMQKRCAKLKKLRRRLQERLDLEVVQRKRKEGDAGHTDSSEAMAEANGPSSSPSADSLRKEIDALTSDFQQDGLQAGDVLQGLAKESSDRLMVAPGLVAATSVGSWR
ncbi:dachshund homolog 2 isoform X2 [Hyalella azteca]|uniref:Dachshund homolog 2 isoform X2 n=1 Tax=Hyalella azteca TaxID=294128 RepID=A0A8B7NDW8_HYAAZ|nr:dachshund homolog 2 isoform X2 [Hyalella azteca]